MSRATRGFHADNEPAALFDGILSGRTRVIPAQSDQADLRDGRRQLARAISH